MFYKVINDKVKKEEKSLINIKTHQFETAIKTKKEKIIILGKIDSTTKIIIKADSKMGLEAGIKAYVEFDLSKTHFFDSKTCFTFDISELEILYNHWHVILEAF